MEGCDDSKFLFVGIDESTKEKIMDKLNKKNKKLENECTICMDAEINTAFVPCGHRASCFDCGNPEDVPLKECPICRRPIQLVLKTFDV